MPAVRATVRSRRFLVLEEEAVSEVAEEEEEVVVVVMMSDWMTRGRKPPERSVAVGCRNAGVRQVRYICSSYTRYVSPGKARQGTRRWRRLSAGGTTTGNGHTLQYKEALQH